MWYYIYGSAERLVCHHTNRADVRTTSETGRVGTLCARQAGRKEERLQSRRRFANCQPCQQPKEPFAKGGRKLFFFTLFFSHRTMTVGDRIGAWRIDTIRIGVLFFPSTLYLRASCYTVEWEEKKKREWD